MALVHLMHCCQETFPYNDEPGFVIMNLICAEQKYLYHHDWQNKQVRDTRGFVMRAMPHTIPLAPISTISQ